jgi:hypothetical protein
MFCIPLEYQTHHIRDVLQQAANFVVSKLLDMFGGVHHIDQEIDAALMKLHDPAPSLKDFRGAR